MCFTLTKEQIESFDTSKFKNNRELCDFIIKHIRDNSSITELDLSRWNVSHITSFDYLFSGCSFLKKLNLSGWDTSKIFGMAFMFNKCISLEEINISGWDTKRVYSMSCMFRCCHSLRELNLSGFNVENVHSTQEMFRLCKSLKNIDFTGWNLREINDMQSMFMCCDSLRELNLQSFVIYDWEIYLCGMFSCCENLIKIDITGWKLPPSHHVVREAVFAFSDNLEDVIGIDEYNYPLILSGDNFGGIEYYCKKNRLFHNYIADCYSRMVTI